jgi:hypothetical protein
MILEYFQQEKKKKKSKGSRLLFLLFEAEAREISMT